MDLNEIKYHIELFTQRVGAARNDEDRQMYTNMLNVWIKHEEKLNAETAAKKARLAAKRAARRPTGLWLVKIIRATNEESPDCDSLSHSYEIEIHSSTGASDTAVVQLHKFNEEWSKDIRIGKSPYGLRDNGECKPITKEEYESHLANLKQSR
jgi:hypothetical protein